MSLRIDITPEQAAHALNSVSHMIWRSDVDAIPAEAVEQQPPLLLDKVSKVELVIDQPPQITYGRLTLVLLVQL